MSGGSSNGVWGDASDELKDFLDSLRALPEAGSCEPLDAFLAAKHITHAGLIRAGARWQAPFTIVYVGPRYVKFRDLATGSRWNHLEYHDFSVMRVIHAGVKDAERVIIAEGETDAAWLTERYTDVDIAILPSGSKSFQDQHAVQLGTYKQVLVATDADRAGEEGAERIQKLMPHAQRLTPPGPDWCEANQKVELPSPDDRPALFMSARKFLAAKMPEVRSYLENGIVPVGGQVMIHGGAKNYKSYLALDMLSQLCQGQGWGGFSFTGESPLRVGVVQYEIKPPYYQDRVRDLFENAVDQELFSDNFHTLTPLQYPQLKAGNKEHLATLLRELEYANLQVLLVDPVRQTLSGADLNSEKDVSLLRELVEPIKAMGVTVVLTHHDNKASVRSKSGDPLGMTGSGAFAGDPDTIVSIALPRELPAESASTCRHRDMYFMLRNAPAPDPRSFEFVPADEMRASHFEYFDRVTEVDAGQLLDAESTTDPQPAI